MTGPSTVERLLAQEGWLRRLAGALAADPALGEELAQETWARALRRPPRELASPRAWLAQVARRVAGERRRDERARARRERAVAATRAEARDERAEIERLEQRTAAHRALARAVLALDEPARSTVVLRYFEGRSAAEIARAAGVPESTVRNRLRRALAELRARLDRASGGERERWLAALAPIALPPRPPLFLAPLLLMTTTSKLLVTAAALAALVGLRLAFDRAPAPVSAPAVAPAEESAPAGDERPARAPASARVAELDGAPESAPPPVDEAPGLEPPPLPAGALEVQVVRRIGAADEPVTRGHVWVGLAGVFLPRDPGQDPRRARVAPLGAEGLARFEGLERIGAGSPYETGMRAVGVELPGEPVVQVLVNLPEEQGARVVVRLGSSELRGTVRDPEGRLVAGARLQISQRGPRGESVVCVLWTDASGDYSARHLPAGSYGVGVDLSGVQDPRGADYATLLDLPADTVVERHFGDPLGLPLWRGRVLSGAGEPLVQQVLTGREGRVHLTRTDEWSYGHHAWNADGSFAIRLEPGTYEVALSLPGRDERHTVVEELVVPADAPRGGAAVERDLVAPGATLSGSASQGRWISLYPAQGSRPLVSLERPADGRYRFDGVPPGRYRLEAGEQAVELTVLDTDALVRADL